MKAKKLKALAEWLDERFDDDLDAMRAVDGHRLREEILAVHGIGEETADDILLYALDKPIFVVDAYTKRLFHRLGLGVESGSYRDYQELFMDNLPHDVSLFNEYHALIVIHAKDVCKKSPVCGRCSLKEICPSAAL